MSVTVMHPAMKGEATGPMLPAKRALVFFTAFAVVLLLVGLGVVGLVSVVPTCDYAEQTGIPRLQADFGFEGGGVPITTRNGPATAYGITRVAEGGAFWSAGVRPGDRPLGGGCSLLRALEEASAGRSGEFTVVRKGTLPAEGGVRAIIRLAPRAPAHGREGNQPRSWGRGGGPEPATGVTFRRETTSSMIETGTSGV